MKTFLCIFLSTAALAATEPKRLPTGAFLDPAARTYPVGNFPLAMVASPDGKQLVLLLNGYRQQAIQVVDTATGEVLQTLDQNAAFLGLTFTPDGKTLFASGGNDDAVYVYRWSDGRAIADGKIELHTKKDPKEDGVAYAAGIATSADGKLLYVAENLGDALAVIDIQTRRLVRRILTDRYPYGVVAAGDAIYVSCWGDNTLNVIRGTKRERIDVGRHPSTMLLHKRRLYVTLGSTDTIAVLDTATGTVIKRLSDAPPAGPQEGSTPNALAMSRNGTRLFVAEADNNAVAVFENDALIGRIPTEWYPAALVRLGNTVIVANAKGRGTAANPDQGTLKHGPTTSYTLGQLNGSMMMFPEAINARALSKRVAAANGWTMTRSAPRYPPFRHVLYIVKENRTYDQVFGDMPAGDGDPSLVFFGARISPNHHAIADRFGLFDRFFVNAEVSATGHNWSTGAYATDYSEKTVPTVYAGAGRAYDYEGTNRGALVDDEDDVAAPTSGYLWNAALRKGITLRNYGEFVVDGPEVGRPDKFLATKRALTPHTSPDYSGFNMDVTDQSRVDVWMREFNGYLSSGKLPALEIIRLPNDHTSGAAQGKPTPFAYMADNDLGLGRIVEAISKSPFWKDTAIFVLEDDAQSGPDHVDSHRSVLMVISAYNRPGVVHRFVNTTDVLATIEEILGLNAMSQFDHYGRPLREIFGGTADLRPYTAIRPEVDLNEKNPPSAAAKSSALLDLSRADAIDDDTFNRILWRVIKGEDVPYPGARRAPVSALGF